MEGSPSTRYCWRMFSSAVMSMYIDGVSTTAPILRRLRPIRASVFFAPYSVKLPPVGSCKPQMRRMSVVLPAPFLPTKP